MSQFYNRYVPPSTVIPSSPTSRSSPSPVEKRKRDHTNTKEKARKRHKVDSPEPLAAIVSLRTKHNEDVQNATNGDSGQDILQRYSVSRFAKAQNGNMDVEIRKKARDKKQQDNQDAPFEKVSANDEIGHGKSEEYSDAKHTGVLQKYEKSKKISEANEHREESDKPSSALSELRGLVPIPQPEPNEREPQPITFSALPSWQAAATIVEPFVNIKFESMGISDKILSNLKSQGIQNAFPIQSTIIPMLVDGPGLYGGDLCVSAATGSGKTLAYVVPIIENLRKSKELSGLRAVIVVPTRELVKQVQETCEMCALGCSIRVVAAQGSKSLQKEQDGLVEEEYVHDPEAYERESRIPLDLSTFSLERTIERARRRDPKKVIGYVRRVRSKADVLVTTPGRLVEHLESTDGFNLDDVEWLVVDEADRLLNESYQEWLDFVVPALQSRKATEDRDRILSYMRMELPPRRVRKVLLSATMTRDVSKLNRIGIENPKFIVLEPSTDAALTHTSFESGGKYALPISLQETAVTIKEGSDKPLILLELLKKFTDVSKPDIASEDTDESTSSSGESDISTDSDGSSSIDSGSSSISSTDDASSTASMILSSSTLSVVESRIKFAENRASQTIHLPHLQRSLIFTRSTASASRLSRLLCIIAPTMASRIATLSRTTASSAASRKALATFRTGKTPVLIATDRASRGIDIPGLQHVISYDIPGSALTYVHRVGRTARAGLQGHAWTIVEHREGRWFWNEIGGKNSDCPIRRTEKVQRMSITIEDEDLKKRYENALRTLGTEVRGD